MTIKIGTAGTLHCGGTLYPARVIALDAVGELPVVLLYTAGNKNQEYAICCKPDGKTQSNIMWFEPEPVLTFKYVNVYKNSMSATVGELEAVNRLGDTDCYGTPREAILKLTYEDGKFVGVEVEEFINA